MRNCRSYMGSSSAFRAWAKQLDPRTIHDEMRLRRWRIREGTSDQGVLLAFGDLAYLIQSTEVEAKHEVCGGNEQALAVRYREVNQCVNLLAKKIKQMPPHRQRKKRQRYSEPDHERNEWWIQIMLNRNNRGSDLWRHRGLKDCDLDDLPSCSEQPSEDQSDDRGA